MDERDNPTTTPNGMTTWRAGCGGSRTSGSEGGPEKPIQGNLDRALRSDPYHSPWQRPTNENGNGLIRRYVGKGTNLSVYTPDDLRAIEHRINTMPRRSIHWSTAQDLYNAAVAMTVDLAQRRWGDALRPSRAQTNRYLELASRNGP
jgi:hypothetical protein